MKLNWLERISHNLKLEWVITSMNVVLEEAKRKAPDKDYSEQELKISVLRDFQKEYLECINESEIIERRYSESFAKSVFLADEVVKLKKELEVLKKAQDF